MLKSPSTHKYWRFMANRNMGNEQKKMKKKTISIWQKLQTVMWPSNLLPELRQETEKKNLTEVTAFTWVPLQNLYLFITEILKSTLWYKTPSGHWLYSSQLRPEIHLDCMHFLCWLSFPTLLLFSLFFLNKILFRWSSATPTVIPRLKNNKKLFAFVRKHC